MIRSTWRLMALSVMLSVCFYGCEAPLPPTPPPTTGPEFAAAAWADWQRIAEGDQAQWDIEGAMALTAAMAQTPSGLTPMIAALGEETVPASSRVLMIICLTPIRSVVNDYVGQLTPLTDATHPPGVRSIATHALGLAETPESVAHVVSLLEDPDRMVREAAMGVLVALHGAQVADKLMEFWADPETTPAIKEQIILSMSSDLVTQFVPLFAEAARDQQLNAGARYKAVTVLGQLGNPEHIPLLQACVDGDPDAYVRERAEGGLALLKASTAIISDVPAAATNN